MWRERALRIVLILIGLLFTAGLYPIADSLRHADQSSYPDDMMLSLYVALGIYLLIASRNPSANRSLIAFAAWSSFAHGAVMTIMAFQHTEDKELLPGVAGLVVIGVTLLVLAPRAKANEQTLAAKA